MESAHTNPIMLCFCSILYYKGLSEHIERTHKVELVTSSTISIEPTAQLEPSRRSERANSSKTNKIYAKRIFNKWRLMVMLTKNPSLKLYRKKKERIENICCRL